MRSRSFKTEGIIIKRQNVGEADRILTVFTRNYGKIRCIARGVRKPTSRKTGHVELFDRSVLYFAKGRNIDTLTQAEVIERFNALRSKLRSLKAAFHAIELVNLMLAEGQENNQVYDKLVSILRAINNQGYATKGQIRIFEKNLLKDLGFGKPGEKTSGEIRRRIESIVERHLNSIDIFKDV